MEADLEKISDVSAVTEPQADTLFKSVLKTSIKTITCLFLLILLSITYFFMRFPYHAMKLYMEFSMYKNALVYCERAVNVLDEEKHGDELAESLLNGIELSNMLLIDHSDLKYAQKLIFFTEKYAANADFDAINSRLDEFYLHQIISGDSGLSLYNALSLFSYKDFVYTRNHYARALTNKAYEILFNGSVRSISNIAYAELQTLNSYDLAVFFNQITYSPVQDVFELTLSLAHSFLDSCLNETNQIGQLYLLKAAYNISKALKDSFANETERIDNAFMIEGQAVTDYFTQKLEQLR